MDLALVERLLCPNVHRAAPLVVRADRVEGGRLVRGTLGCPECRTEWSVVDGVAAFGQRAALAAVAPPAPDAAAALLNLTEPALVISDGAPAALVRALTREYAATVVVLDAPDAPESVTAIDGAPRVPIAAGVARAALVLRPGRDPAFVASAATVLVPGGRLLGAARIPVPGGIRELARDPDFWLGERESVTVPVTLRRSGPAPTP